MKLLHKLLLQKVAALSRPCDVALALATATLGFWWGCESGGGTVGAAQCDSDPCICEVPECICPKNGDCDIECVEDCALRCEGAQACSFDCAGPDCNVECSGSETCDVTIEIRGTVRCSGAGDCTVTCHGPCLMDCAGSGLCNLACEPDDVGDSLMPHECGDEGVSCGPCP